jgi:class 3 adenylate cyclase
LVVWPPNARLEESCQRAIQCALDIQGKLNNQEISPNKRLSVKIGIGVGDCTILVVGGVFQRFEYLSVGDALAQACESETKATAGGETICSEDVHNLVKGKFEMVEAVGGDDHGHGPSEHDMKFYKIIKLTGQRVQIKADAFLMRTKFSLAKLKEKIDTLKSFVPNAIVKYLDIEKEIFSKEIRMITSMFLNLKVDLSQTKTEQGLNRIQKIVSTVQRCVYRTRGALNKFLMDDKGSVMLICWGLPPGSQYDDHVRGVLCGLSIIEELKKLSCGAFMGLASGTCFTGVCGTIGGRREYSLLGSIYIY